MNFQTAILIALCFAPDLVAQDVFGDANKSLGLSSQWKRIDHTRDIRHGDKWNWAVYKNDENQDLLTLACRLEPCSLEAAGTHDNALEFAPSGLPYWTDTPSHYETGPVKIDKTAVRIGSSKSSVIVPLLRYVNVNEAESLPTLMANGLIAVRNGRTYYVQHTSPRPNRDTFAMETMEALLKWEEKSSRLTNKSPN